MLCVVDPARVAEVLAVCERWEVHGAPIGTVTETGVLRVLRDGEPVGEVPVDALVDGCPLYDLEPARPPAPPYPAPPRVLAETAPAREALLALVGSPALASRRPLFQQYDWLVQSRTVRRPEEADAAVLALRDGSAVAVTIDGNGRRVACDPRAGTVEAVLEAAANLACAGAEPLGLTNCLNFGNPEKPTVAWQLTESVAGLGDVCRALGVPVVGGNVSLYNEGPEGAIYPTPVVGLVGEVPDAARAGRAVFARAGDAIALVGPFRPRLPGSELAKLRGEALPDGLPAPDVAGAAAAHAAVCDAVRAGAVHSAHDVAEGGLLATVAEACLLGGVGARLDLAEDPGDEALFGECPGRGFVVSGAPQALRALAGRTEVVLLGTVGGEELVGGGVRAGLGELREAWGALAPLFP
jgi:phosphoribosylformylglycinamidine synthase